LLRLLLLLLRLLLSRGPSRHSWVYPLLLLLLPLLLRCRRCTAIIAI
jgi:hypothetical protein